MREVEVGKTYHHFKGKDVFVVLIGYDSETEEKKVVYEHDGKYWIRDYDMFLSKVDKEKYPECPQEYRFE